MYCSVIDPNTNCLLWYTVISPPKVVRHSIIKHKICQTTLDLNPKPIHQLRNDYICKKKQMAQSIIVML